MVKTFKELFEERIGKSKSIQKVDFLKRSDDRFMEIEDIQKMNKYHGADGRFTFAPTHAAHGSGGGGTSTQGGGKGGEGQSSGGGKALEDRNSRIEGLKAYEEMSSMDEKRAEIDKAIDIVRDYATNDKPAPFERKECNRDKVKEKANCDDDTAKRAEELAKGIYDEAEKVEPKITSDIMGIAESCDGKMWRIDSRMKEETSLARKIVTDAYEEYDSGFKGDLDHAAGKISDAVRYTIVFENGDFSKGYQDVKAALAEKGYTEVKFKNNFEKYSNGTYDIKSVQCKFQDKNGYEFELQFHTYETQGTKELTHPMYEESRKRGQNPSKKNKLKRLTVEAYTFVTDPEGVMTLNK